MKTDRTPGSQPHRNPRYEIYCVERAAGLSEQDALNICGAEFPLLMQPGEKTTPTRSRVQRQILKRLDTRIAAIDECERGVDREEHHEFILRNSRARAELDWIRLVVLNGGVEPELDDDGAPLPPATTAKQFTPQPEAGPEQQQPPQEQTI